MKTSSTQKINFVPKGWGFEKWFHNSEKYCGKLLYFVKGKKCSWHYHKLKEKGDNFHVYTGLRHQMEALEDTELFEFSTQHFDSDSYRIKKGD